MISDPKQIREHIRSTQGLTAATSPTKAAATPVARSETPTRPDSAKSLSAKRTKSSASPEATKESSTKAALSLQSGLYRVTDSDSKQDVAAKFLALIALGPITNAQVESALGTAGIVLASELAQLFASHTQTYRAGDAFTAGDIYPSVALGACVVSPDTSYAILKDKAYKELRPWSVRAYTDYERRLVLDNACRALSRLGFLDTHPLRRQIVENTQAPPKKTPALGGGLLSGAHKKSATVSPHIGPSRAANRSPVKAGAKRAYVAVLSLSGSLSEDEKHAKRTKNAKRSDSSGTSYTLPSSANEDVHGDDEVSDDEAKAAARGLATPLARATSEKKQQFYTHLAAKFRAKYHEYEELHRELTRGPRSTPADAKRQVMRLFEMHNSLAEWKRKLWDYHNENHMAEGIMNLSRHRKKDAVLVPGRFPKAHTTSPAVLTADRFKSTRAPKKALDY